MTHITHARFQSPELIAPETLPYTDNYDDDTLRSVSVRREQTHACPEGRIEGGWLVFGRRVYDDSNRGDDYIVLKCEKAGDGTDMLLTMLVPVDEVEALQRKVGSTASSQMLGQVAREGFGAIDSGHQVPGSFGGGLIHAW